MRSHGMAPTLRGAAWVTPVKHRRLVVAALALVVSAQALGASAARAAYPGANGRIAYQVEGEDGAPTHLCGRMLT